MRGARRAVAVVAVCAVAGAVAVAAVGLAPDRGPVTARRTSDVRATSPAAETAEEPATTAPAPPGAPWMVVGYLPTWGVYERGFHPRDLEESGAAAALTHIDVAFGGVEGGECVRGDEFAETGRAYAAGESVDGIADPGGMFGQLRKLKERNPQLRILWSIGGAGRSQGFPTAAADPARFAASCRAMLDDPAWQGLFDGIDIDWEFPPPGPSFGQLMGALRAELPGRLVTAAVPGTPELVLDGRFAGASASVDWFNLMAYDYAGWWTPGSVAPHSPLTPVPEALPAGYSATDAVAAHLATGVPPAKLVLGVGFYGRGWTGVQGDAPGSPAAGAAPGSSSPGLEEYRTLSVRCPPSGSVGGTVVARCGGEWWSYDTPDSLRAKADWARGSGLGGVMAWELGGDTDDASLLGALVGP